MTCYHNKTLDTCPFCWIDAPWVYRSHALNAAILAHNERVVRRVLERKEKP